MAGKSEDAAERRDETDEARLTSEDRSPSPVFGGLVEDVGRQIQIALSDRAEHDLEACLRKRCPSVRIIDRFYTEDWDRQALKRSAHATDWLIIDTRTEPILRASAKKIVEGPQAGLWQIICRGSSCIEWARRLLGRQEGRLYLDTSPHAVGSEIEAVVGGEVKRMYAVAVRWIRGHCYRADPGSRYPVWRDAPERRDEADER